MRKRRLQRRFVGVVATLIIAVTMMPLHNCLAGDSSEQNQRGGQIIEQTTAHPVTGDYIHYDNEREVPSLEDSSSGDYHLFTSTQAQQSYFRSPYATPVKDQGNYGTCWATSILGMAESELIENNSFSKSTDLSELQLAYFAFHSVPDPLGGTTNDIFKAKSGTDWLQIGGDYACACDQLASWTGVVNESDVPYSSAETVRASGLDSSYAYSKDAAHLQGCYFINKKDSAGIKQNIVDYGGVCISYCALDTWGSNAYYNSATAAYYCPTRTVSDHSVEIVGWDDNYPATNFVSKPAGNGAWIVKNSWGTSWGDKGYFYLSYYDQSIDNTCAVFRFDSAANYDNNYQYDGGQRPSPCGFNGENQLKVANVFTTKANQAGSEKLQAASFTTYECSNCRYTVQVYKNLKDATNPESGTLCATKTGNTTYDGYYTVPFDTTVNLAEGTTFSIVVTLASDKLNTVSIEAEDVRPDDGCTGEVSAAAGQSLVCGYNSWGTATGWEDFGAQYNRNIRVKAFTTNTSSIPTQEVALSSSSERLKVGDTTILTATVTPKNMADNAVVFSSDNCSVATVSTAGVVTGVSTGTATITATTADKTAVAQCMVTVENDPVYNGIDYSAVYDEQFYYDNNPDVAAAFGYDGQALLTHFVNYGMSEGRRAKLSFDVYSYKANNADLRNAFGNNWAAYYNHYMTYGINENRVTAGNCSNPYTKYNGVDYSAVFDEMYYMENQADLQKALGDKLSNYIMHFVNYGMKEGRQAKSSFDVNMYRYSYQDLNNAFGNGLRQYYEHYMNYGIAEGRNANPNVYQGINYANVYNQNYYKNKYNDLKNAFGSNSFAYIQHFVNYGMEEGRQASAAFNVSIYAGNYADLRDAFGSNRLQYYYHYIKYGKKEGRVAA